MEEITQDVVKKVKKTPDFRKLRKEIRVQRLMPFLIYFAFGWLCLSVFGDGSLLMPLAALGLWVYLHVRRVG
jgi:hypothetical protein